MEHSEGDLDALARTAWGEARDQGAAGMAAVCWVAVTRAMLAAEYMVRHGKGHPLYGNGTVESACTMAKQFSCWNFGDINRSRLLMVDERDPIFREAESIACAVMDGVLINATRNATHYYAAGTPKPKWAEGRTPVATIGAHIFYKLD